MFGQVVWTGAANDGNFSTPGNWQGGVVPPNTGADSAVFNQSSGYDINVNLPANFSGLTLESPSSSGEYFFYSSNSNSLTIGSGGISTAPQVYSYLDLPVILSANQTWTTGTNSWIDVFGQMSGTGSLTTNGSVYIDNFNGNNTFSGGLTVASGFLYLGYANAAGTGPITIDSGAQLYAYDANLPNAVTLGANVTLGSWSGSTYRLTFSGPVALQSAATTVNISGNSSVAVAGALSGPASTVLSLVGSSAQLPSDGGAQVVFQGTLNNIAGINVDNLALILAPSGSPATAFTSLSSSGLQVNSQGYLGLDGTFASASTPGAVAAFLSTYGPTLGPSISGTLGFDTIANPSSPNVFGDAINLSAFTSSLFLGLGSQTAAVLTGTITPPANTYSFGGGGGTLTVQSALTDGGSPRSLLMNSGSEPLTVILQSTGNTYSGGTTSNGGVLIFDSPTPTVAGSIQLAGSYSGNVGYVGYTSKATNITAAGNFVSLFNPSTATGVIGFDTVSGDTALGPINDAINLSGFSGSGPFLGTSTLVTLAGVITPANNQYQFTGFKGGSLTVSSPLTATAASAVIGLAYPVEAAGTISTVTLSGTNTYTGGTVLNSGAVFISNGSALGTGTISIPATDRNYPAIPPPSLAPYGATVTLGNPISVGASQYNTTPPTYQYGPAVELGNYSTSDMLVINGVISDYPSKSGQIGIQGPVTINGTNTYSGGTTFNNNSSANVPVYIGNNSAFGTGQIWVETPATLIPDAGGSVTLANAILLNETLTLGAVGNPYLLTLNGIISGYNGMAINGPVALNGANTFSGQVVITNAAVSVGNAGALGSGEVELTGSTVTDNFANPSYLDLSGDAASTIVLEPSSTLTLNTDYNASPANFYGNITGNSTDQVVIAGTGTQALFGNSTYGGGTTVSSGAGLVVGSATALGAGTVTVAAEADLLTNTGVVLTNPLTLTAGSPGAVLGGNGTFSPSGGTVIAGGVTISPGSDGNLAPFAGNLSFGTQLTLGSGGIYVFDVENAGGVAGTDYDTVNVSGALTISATPVSPFQIDLRSIDPSGSTQGLATFNSSLAYSWTLITAGSISGFNASDFTINTASFQNTFGAGVFSVSQNENSLDLNFTPVPEPSTWAMMGAGLLVVVPFALRRRRTSAV
jgi:fibronectin-binding autotransporter adhesin